jgi:Holliday junction resolvase RusA-like endonuclease
MAKRRQTLKLRIPPYVPPRSKWRRVLHSELIKACQENAIRYLSKDNLELEVVLYLGRQDLKFHDVDNRLKDIMDAMQGRAGGGKKSKTLVPIIANDSQIYKVTIEKKHPPKQSCGLGHLVIKNYKNIG